MHEKMTTHAGHWKLFFSLVRNPGQATTKNRRRLYTTLLDVISEQL